MSLTASIQDTKLWLSHNPWAMRRIFRLNSIQTTCRNFCRYNRVQVFITHCQTNFLVTFHTFTPLFTLFLLAYPSTHVTFATSNSTTCASNAAARRYQASHECCAKKKFSVKWPLHQIELCFISTVTPNQPLSQKLRVRLGLGTKKVFRQSALWTI